MNMCSRSNVTEVFDFLCTCCKAHLCACSGNIWHLGSRTWINKNIQSSLCVKPFQKFYHCDPNGTKYPRKSEYWVENIVLACNQKLPSNGAVIPSKKVVKSF